MKNSVIKYLKITGYMIGGFMLFCILLAIFIPKEDKKTSQVSSTETKETPEERKKAQIERTIRAGDLYYLYEQNEIKADEDFKGKKFYVQGRITNIANDIMDNPYITLGARNEFLSVQCAFNDKKVLTGLSKGQQVTILGTCNGKIMNVLMEDCSLVENYEIPK